MKLPYAAFAGLLLLAGCVTKNTSRQNLGSFQNAMRKADQSPGDKVASETGVTRFKKAYTNLKSEKIRNLVEEAYATDAYFNDTLVELKGNKAIADYMVKTGKNSESIKVSYQDTAHSGSNYYLRWTMIIRSKALQHGDPVYSTGMTLLRFDHNGRIVVHQDYWDSAGGFYKHLPILGPEIEFIQSRLRK